MESSQTTLPIDALAGPFAAALATGPVVVSAATGSGKSTRLPVWAREQGRVLVIEPRRVAATSLAYWVAEQVGTHVGDEVGYAIRHDTRCDERTGIVFVTPGIALQWLARDALAGFRAVVLDEFHERRWDTDLLLALLRDTGRHRLVVTSATIDGPRVAEQLGARHLQSEGRAYPVQVEHLAREPRALPRAKGLADRVADAVRGAFARTDGDVLAFLPGRGEIADAAKALRGSGAACVELHAGADAASQRRALRPGDERRVILATNVAESSVTVPGVTAVVDSGLERRTHRRNGRTVLGLQAIAADSAEQRRGRAGRTAPGLCLRLWGHNAPLATVTPPAIQREDLTEPVLAAACASRPARALAFPDALREEALAGAEATLTQMGAIDADGHATERGRALFALPVDTALAHWVLAMPDAASAGFMADLAGALSTRRPVAGLPHEARERERVGDALGRHCDATLRVAALRGQAPEGVRVREDEQREARRLADQVRELAGLPPRPADDDGTATAMPTVEAAASAAPATAFVRRERRRFAMGNGGEEVEIGRDSLMPDDAEAALVLDSHSVPGKGTRQTLTMATVLAPIPLDALIRAGGADAELAAPEWRDGALVVRRQWRYAGRVIASERTEPVGAEARRALAQLTLDGTLLAPAGKRLTDDLAAWSLYVALGFGEGDIPEARAWLAGRLAALGVESDADIELVEPDDLRFEGVPAWERERFDRTYPREVQLSGLRMRIHYDVRRRTVTAEKIEGSRKTDPKRWELPAWQGWHVQFQRASRIVDVR
jgi:ATP-dependent helicase HrpB